MNASPGDATGVNPLSLAADPGCSTIRFSIITVCYNEQRTIAKTLESILGQTWGSVEAIVIDGASSDGTAEAIQPYLDRLAHFLTEPDAGLYDAMNKGLALATGDFVCFMNAGDRFADSMALDRVARAIDDRGRCVFARARIEGDGVGYENPPAGTLIANWLGRGIPSHQVTFYPFAFASMHRYDLTVGSAADTDYTFSAFATCGWTFVDTLVAAFQMGGVSNRFETWKAAVRATRERREIFARHRRWFNGGASIVYVAGPIIGWCVQRLLGRRFLASMRNAKANRPMLGHGD